MPVGESNLVSNGLFSDWTACTCIDDVHRYRDRPFLVFFLATSVVTSEGLVCPSVNVTSLSHGWHSCTVDTKNAMKPPWVGGASLQVKKRKEDVAEAVLGLHGFCLKAAGQRHENLLLISGHDMYHPVSVFVIEVFHGDPRLHIV